MHLFVTERKAPAMLAVLKHRPRYVSILVDRIHCYFEPLTGWLKEKTNEAVAL